MLIFLVGFFALLVLLSHVWGCLEVSCVLESYLKIRLIHLTSVNMHSVGYIYSCAVFLHAAEEGIQVV